MNELQKVEDGLVVSMDYILHVDGELVDESTEKEPLEFIQGSGGIIPGLEKALYGMAIGDSKVVQVSAKDGYGEVDEDAFSDVPRDQFPDDIPLEEGIELQVRDEDGSMMQACIDNISDTTIRLDFNHPLAGMDLLFNIKIVGLRQATAEELEHGHVHDELMHEEDEE